MNGRERVRMGENDLGKMGHQDERWREIERDGEVDEWHMMPGLPLHLSLSHKQGFLCSLALFLGFVKYLT